MLCGSLSSVAADEITPALLYNMGGKFDKSFNEAAYNGAERFKAETGIDYIEFEPTNEAQREQALRNMARRGANIIVAVGFSDVAGIGEEVGQDRPLGVVHARDAAGADRAAAALRAAATVPGAAPPAGTPIVARITGAPDASRSG